MPYHVAQYNIAWLVEPFESALYDDFREALDRINRLGEAAPGFVWRHQTEDGNSTGVRVRDDDRILINFSVWEDVESLFNYTYRSGHVELFRKRTKWFSHEDTPYAVLWWIPAGTTPAVHEAEQRLALLKAAGPTAEAFTFKSRFPPPATDSL
ncbi:MAG: DUF3291 domain-containing protein [Dehalococcoidia bacterium]